MGARTPLGFLYVVAGPHQANYCLSLKAAMCTATISDINVKPVKLRNSLPLRLFYGNRHDYHTKFLTRLREKNMFGHG